MRILHTSDWHLGLSTGAVSRLEDQRCFLDWLARQLAVEKVDALIVAGDIFDSVQPSAEAQEVYYRFLAGLPATGVRQVVIVGGNHDSPSRLEAPREVLSALNVHVVGGLPAQGAPLDPLVVPLRARGSDEVDAVCLAVPFVHEYRLGVRTTALDRGSVAEAFRERFTELYARLADRAEDLFPGRVMVATGHLVLEGASYDAGRDEIHQVGFIGGLPPSILDPRLAYVALGHIHRAWPVVEGRAWYCGSPVPVSVSEAELARKVLLVDLSSESAPKVAPVEVPCFRELRAMEGAPDELELAIRSLTSAASLPPLLHLRAILEGPEPGLRERLMEAVAEAPVGSRPQIVELRERYAGPELVVSEAPVTRLDELSVAEVFERLCRSVGVQESDELAKALVSLQSASEEDFDASLGVARGGEGGAI